MDDECKNVLMHVVQQNYSLDELRAFLEKNLELNEQQKKMVIRFWKTHGQTIINII